MENDRTDLNALTEVISALKRLNKEDQQRTIQAVATFLGLSPVSHSQTPLHPIPTAGLQKANASPLTFSEDRTVSSKEFLRDKKPASDVERVACLAYYLTHYKDTAYFKTIDISALNTESAQPKFSNASMAVENAAKAGLLVPAIKGSKQLSAAGEHFVQLMPDRDAAREAIKSNRLKRRTRRPVVKKSASATKE